MRGSAVNGLLKPQRTREGYRQFDNDVQRIEEFKRWLARGCTELLVMPRPEPFPGQNLFPWAGKKPDSLPFCVQAAEKTHARHFVPRAVRVIISVR